MKFLHISDLHLGKSIHEFSLLEDQEYILKTILNIADDHKVQLAFISGDVFDRSIAPTEALYILEEFLDGLIRRNIKCFIIAGNHDSSDRLSFGSKFMQDSGIYISKAYEGQMESYKVEDEFGKLNIYLLPFIRPIHIRRLFPEEEIKSYTDAIEVVIKNTDINKDERNILLAHQFVTSSKANQDEISLGGSDNVEAKVFGVFDYIALGHLHRPQHIDYRKLRYAGSPLKYSFAEVNHKKSVSIVEIKEKGDLKIKEVPLVPLRNMHEIKGKYMEITSKDFYKDLELEDFYHISLTDEEDQVDALSKLRVIYPNLLLLDYDNTRTRMSSSVEDLIKADDYSPMELFNMLYKEQNGQPLSEEQTEFLASMIEEIWEGQR